jgi:3-hydroxy-9,10-secoandrosta-1,3,5(10)-triene-9,17-dione monooxygenase
MSDNHSEHATSATKPQHDVVSQARDLSSLLALHAHEAEQQRRPSDTVIEALKASDIFKLMAPAAYGGLELDLDTFFEVGLALGEGDASMSWVANFYIEHVWMLCQFPASFQQALFADQSYVLAPAMISPTGVVKQEAKGWRLSGRWSWSTGIMHADWVIPAAIMKVGDKRAPFFFAIPADEVKVEDTWFIDGMQGTGSNDVLIEDVFVPEDRCVAYLDMVKGEGPGAEIHEGPLYRTPMLPILGLAAGLPALGQAKTCLRLYRERLEEIIESPSPTRQAKASNFMRLAEADIQVQQAELLLREMVDDVMVRRNNSTSEDRARWATQLAWAINEAKRAIARISEVAGASAHFQTHPMQRAVRDINTIASHVIFDLDTRLEHRGRSMLGQDVVGILV